MSGRTGRVTDDGNGDKEEGNSEERVGETTQTMAEVKEWKKNRWNAGN